jgi:Fe-S cluster assembly iron-binding protein IscA
MLALTDAAAEVIRDLVAESPLSEAAGLRISAAQLQDGSPGLNLTLTDAPSAEDVVLDDQRVRVFLEPVVAPALDDKILDAHAADGDVSFSIEQR